MIYSIKRKKDTEHGADGLLVFSLPLIGGIDVLRPPRIELGLRVPQTRFTYNVTC